MTVRQSEVLPERHHIPCPSEAIMIVHNHAAGDWFTVVLIVLTECGGGRFDAAAGHTRHTNVTILIIPAISGTIAT